MSESFTVDIHAKMRSLPRLGASASRLRTGTIDVSQAISIPLLIQCNQVLMLQSFLHAPSQVGLEDTVLFKKITDCPLGVKVLGECTSGTVKTATYPHLVRWYRYMQQFVAKHGSTGIPGSELGTTGDITPKGGKALDDVSNNNKAVKHGNALPGNEENKLVLPGAEEGKVVTRFPPEASGFMHIGHAKAALINSMLRDKYKGKMIFRFDDTNPAKEKESYEHSIIHDLAWIGIKADVGPTYTSDYFDTMLTFCDQMLKQGTAYVDFTPVEEMRRLREAKLPTPCREHSIEENCRLWEEMKKGSEVGQTCCVRAKIDVESLNGTMRDPTMYRVVLIPHARTGTKYKVYPTYDFACPIVDSIEGVTHALRTVEYRDRNEQYYWFVKTLQIRRPELDDYSRLNMEYTVMSKRKLALLVDEGVVDGWDDPRFPTVRALCRRGLYPEALRQFVEIQGMSKVVNVMEWSKLWVFNTKLLEHEVPRYTAVSKDAHTVATVEGEITTNVATRLRHKKNESLGTKPIHYSDKILLESADVALLREGDEITLMDWGNAFVSNIQRDASGRAVSCSMRLHLEGDVRKTKYKLNWLAENAPHVVLNCYEFDNILTVKKPDPEDPNFDSIVNRQSKFMQPLIGEGVMKEVRKGDRFQIERRGYYIVDSVEESHLTLFAIPDGSTKINHLSAKAAAGFTNPVESSGKSGNPSANNNNHKAVSGKTLEEKRAEKAALKAAQKKSSTNS